MVGMAPTVTLTASPSSVLMGLSTTLNWSSTNASTCTKSGGWSGSESVSGSRSVVVSKVPQAYVLTCVGSGGSASATTTVVGSSGGGTVLPATRGACGSANGVPSASMPVTNLCSLGNVYNEESVSGQSTWQWVCAISDPTNPGETASCSAPQIVSYNQNGANSGSQTASVWDAIYNFFGGLMGK